MQADATSCATAGIGWIAVKAIQYADIGVRTEPVTGGAGVSS